MVVDPIIAAGYARFILNSDDFAFAKPVISGYADR